MGTDPTTDMVTVGSAGFEAASSPASENVVAKSCEIAAPFIRRWQKAAPGRPPGKLPGAEVGGLQGAVLDVCCGH